MKKLRVPLPRKSPSKKIELAKKVLQKHLAEGDKSPLKGFDWNTLQTQIAQAEQWHDQSETLRGQAAQLTMDRDNVLKNVVIALQSSRDVLTGHNLANMKYLTDWGFQVIETPAKAKPVATTTPAEIREKV